MRTLKILLVGAVALIAVAGCKKTDELVDTTPVYDDAYYASYASISSSDSGFTSNSTGGTIHFKVEGGEVKVFVSCGTDWHVQNDNPGSFKAYASDSYYLTVSAEQNYVEEELTGTITLMTAEMHIAFASITVTQNAYGAPEITVETNEWNAPAVGKLTTTITVDSTDEWTIDGGDEWLTVEKSEVGINLTAEENEDTEERTAEIVLTCTDGYKSDSETITVTQDGLAYITLSEKELSLPQFGDPVSVTVETNFDWEYSFNADWLTIDNDEEEGTLVITYDTNSTGKVRDCVVTITSGDGASNVAEAELAVTQIASSLTVEATEWHAPAVGELTTEIGVEASYEWKFENDADWLTVEKTETSLRLTAEKNTETAERTTEVVLTCTDGTTSTSSTVTVTQDAKAYISLSEEKIYASGFRGSASVTVESNFDWDYSYDTANDWLTFKKDEENNSLTISYTINNTESDRDGLVVITAGDGAENLAEIQFSITQSCDISDALILEYTITSASTTIRLPIYNVTNANIDWGDDSWETASSSQPTHKYTTPGIYAITINGDIARLCGIRSGKAIDGCDCLTAVIQWGDTGLTSMEYAFYECSGLTSLPDGAGSFSNVTTFSYAFYDCSSFEKLPEGLFDNCASVNTFAYCFYGCSGLTSIPYGLFDNCPSVTTFEDCFYGCSGLTSIPDWLFGNCPSVTTFYECFHGCSGLTLLPAGLFGNCPSVTTFCRCFRMCSGLTSIPSGLFDNCPSVWDFYQCFQECTRLTSVPYDLFSNCMNATTFSDCFFNCSHLVSAPSFEGLTKASAFYCCFAFCSSLVYAPSFKGCSSVTTTNASFYDIFYGCSSLAFAPSFEGCTNLTSIDCIKDIKTWTTLPENMFAGCNSITSFSCCFLDCTALVTVPGGIFSGCTAATSFEDCFYYCTALETVPDNLFSGCTAATSFCGVFQGCSALKTVPVNIFDDNLAAQGFLWAFRGCSSVVGESPYTEVDVDGEMVKVHLYERSKYSSEMGCTSTPNNYTNCFMDSTFSDMDSIPSKWGGNGN